MQLPMHPGNKLRNLLSRIAPFQRKSPGVIQGFFCRAFGFKVLFINASFDFNSEHDWFKQILCNVVYTNRYFHTIPTHERPVLQSHFYCRLPLVCIGSTWTD
jgi:hypothetical protein